MHFHVVTSKFWEDTKFTLPNQSLITLLYLEKAKHSKPLINPWKFPRKGIFNESYWLFPYFYIDKLYNVDELTLSAYNSGTEIHFRTVCSVWTFNIKMCLNLLQLNFQIKVTRNCLPKITQISNIDSNFLSDTIGLLSVHYFGNEKYLRLDNKTT